MREIPLCPPDGLTTEAVEKLAFLAGACHDLGKATSRFQSYMYTDDRRKKEMMKADPLTRHALLGAIIAYALLLRSDLDRTFKSTPMGRVLRFAPFWVIRRHHGNLLFPKKDLELRKADKELLAQQLNDCPAVEIDRILARIAEVGGFMPQPLISHAEISAQLVGVLDQLGDESLDLVTDLDLLRKNSVASLAPWLLLQQLFSVLLAADKGWSGERIAQLLATNQQNQHVTLSRKVPVHVTYFTSWVDDDGKARDYVLRLEELAGAHVSCIGVGPGRDQTIVRRDVLLDRP